MKPSESGKSVILYQRTKNGTDAMNRPVYITTPVTVKNVFIGRPTQEEIVNELTLSGKKWVHTLGIPKGDTHDWENAVIEFNGKKWRAIGAPVEGIPELMPFIWDKNVKVEAYEQ